MKRRACAVAVLCSFLQMGWAQTTTTAPAKLIANEAMAQLQEIDKLYKAGKEKEALAALNEIVPRTDIPLARWARAQILVKLKDFKAAQVDIDALIAADDKNPQYVIAKGQLCVAGEDFAGAVQAFEKAHNMVPNAPPAFKAQLLSALVDARMKTKDFTGARMDASELVRLLPTDPRPYRMRAQVNIESGNFLGAVADLNSVIDISQRIAKAGNQQVAAEATKIEQEAAKVREDLLIKAKMYGEAIKTFEPQLRAKPGDEALEDLLSEAVKSLQFIGGKMPLEATPKSEADKNHRATKATYEAIEKKVNAATVKAGAAMGAKDYAGAEAAATEGVKLAAHAATYQLRGEARFALGKLAEAARDYRIAAALYAAHWAADSTMNFRSATAAEVAASWAAYLERRIAKTPNPTDKKFEAALADEAAGRLTDAFMLLKNIYSEDYAHKPAVALYDRIYKQKDAIRPVFLDRAQKALAAGKLDEARTMGENALATGSFLDNSAYLVLAQVELRAGNSDKLKAHLASILSNKFDDPTGNLIQGDIYAKDGKQNDALLAYSAGSGGMAVASLSGDAKVCAEKRDAIEAKLGKKPTDEFYINTANSALRDKRHKDVVVALSRIIALGMDGSKNFELRGWANFSLMRYTDALRDYETAAKKDPQLKLALSIADCHYNLKQYDQAIVFYTQGLPDSKNPFLVHYLRGLSYLRTKQFEKARDDGDAAIKLDDKSHRGYYLRASANYWLREVAKAADDFKLTEEKAPANSMVKTMCNLHLMMLLQHRIKGTEKEFQPKFEEGGPGLTDPGI